MARPAVGKMVKTKVSFAIATSNRMGNETTYIGLGPFKLLRQHLVHRRHDLSGHVYESFGENKADMARDGSCRGAFGGGDGEELLESGV